MNTSPQSRGDFAGRSPLFWGVLYCASIAAIAVLRITDAIPTPVGLILFVGAMGLLIPLVQATERKNCANPAIIRYNRRMLVASLGYVLGLGIAIALWNNYDLSTPVVFAIALLPSLPTFGMIWAMVRYLIEEQDEYLRHRSIMAALISLGMVLAIGIFWGFLEMFELVPHIWAWWVLPVWSIGLGITQAILALRDRRSEPHEEEA